jgi:hypothetical protein
VERQELSRRQDLDASRVSLRKHKPVAGDERSLAPRVGFWKIIAGLN